jgi:hypothetical protein
VEEIPGFPGVFQLTRIVGDDDASLELDGTTSDHAYPRAHVHVNATFAHGAPVGRLHVQTGPVGPELVIRHLTDWGVKPRTDGWETILDESVAGFD